MQLFLWIGLGIFLGCIANILSPEPNRGGIFSATILGIIGAFLGGILGSMLFRDSSSYTLPSFLVTIAGSLFVLYFARGVKTV